MGLRSSEVVVTGTGRVYVAPVGTAFPSSISAEVDENDWTDLGYITEEGARFAFGRRIREVMAWQSLDPIRLVITSAAKEVSFDLEQWTHDTWQLANGGGSVSEPLPGEYEYAPPDDDEVDERAFIIEGADEDRDYRFCLRRAANVQDASWSFSRETAAVLPITLRILTAAGGERPYFIQTDDDAWATPLVGLLTEAAEPITTEADDMLILEAV